jgi:HEAT repeat protein
MNLFGRHSESQSTSNVNIRKLEKTVQADKSTFRQATADAILALADHPFTEEIYSFLTVTASRGPYTETATNALGRMGHPRAIDWMIGSIRYPGLSHERIARAFCNSRNQLAVAPLLEIALTSTNYISIEHALQVLRGIGTTDAQEALQRFYGASSRIVTVLWTGFETAEPISTAFLGQKPSESELDEARALLVRENVFCFGTQQEALGAVERCLDSPKSAQLVQLESFLANGFQPPRGEVGAKRPGISRRAGVPDLPRQAVDAWIEVSHRNFETRNAEVRNRLASGNKERLEVHILNQLGAIRERALSFYQLLPNRSDIAMLHGLEHPFQSEDEIPAYLVELRHRDEMQHQLEITNRVEQARLRPNEPNFRLAAFHDACQNNLDSGLSLLDEFVEPLLKDARWDVRKKALDTLSTIPSEKVLLLLERYIASEADFELQTAARETMRSLSKLIASRHVTRTP